MFFIEKRLDENSLSSLGTDNRGKKWEDYETIVCPDGQVIDMVKLLDDQQRAKAALVHMMPAFGGFVNNLRFIYTFRISTQATDGYNLLVNPQFTYNLDLTEKCFVMAHEVMHCLLNHMRRGRGHDPKMSNIAADYECNISLVDMELFKFDTIKKLGAYIDKKYSNMGYEAIYKDCTGNPNQMNNGNSSQQNKSGQQNNKNGNSGSQGNGQGSGQSEQYTADYINGWNQAIEDYKKGKISL